jgi:hypothetical protein
VTLLSRDTTYESSKWLSSCLRLWFFAGLVQLLRSTGRPHTHRPVHHFFFSMAECLQLLRRPAGYSSTNSSTQALL